MSKSEKRWQWVDAMLIAEELKRRLAPHCERIEITGSLRRHKPSVGDIELLYIPKIGTRPDGLFGVKQFSEADAEIEGMLASGAIRKRPKIDGSFTWGALNKHAIDAASGIAIDFFAVDKPENWWVRLVVTTGSLESNMRLTTGAQKLGKSLNAYGCGVTNEDGSTTPATSEREVFELCGVPYRESNQR